MVPSQSILRARTSCSHTIAMLFIFFFALSCSPQSDMMVDPINEKEIKFLALGDSYTIGQGVNESERWPVQLSTSLAQLDYEIEETKVIAQTGWTTGNLINALEGQDLENYNLVSLLIGVNNQFQGQPFAIFQTELDSLLNLSIAYANGKENVFVVSIPDYGVTPFGSANSESIANQIDMYNNYIKAQCDNRSIPFINITEISRELGDGPDALATDNLHPSAFQYSEWVKRILPVVENILEE